MNEIKISEKSIVIQGITAVISISDKEAEIERTDTKITLFGKDIQAKKLALEQGLLELSAEQIYAVKFGNAAKKFSFKNIFK